MMGLFTVSKLLLMTLLLQLTKEDEEWKTHPTPEADSSVRFGEFCLRISEDSHRTSSQSVTQLPSKSAHPTKQATQLPQQPTTEPAHQDNQSTEPTTQPTSTVWDSAQTDIQEISMIPMMHPLNLQSHVNDGCRCQEKERKFPNSLIIKVVIWFPSETCNSTEVIVTAKDGSNVCLRIPSFLEYYIELSRRWSEPVTEASSDEEPSVISPPLVDPTTELPITTQLSVIENNQFDDPNPPTIISSFVEAEEMEDKRVNGKSSIDHHGKVSAQCESCNFITNLDSVDPKDVQSLNVKMQSFPCPVHIHLILKNYSDFCLDSNQFNTLLKKLENPPPHEDHIHQTLTNNGCRCQEKEEKPPTETFIITRIWPPSETCNSTEFIETETGGNEVCVTAASFLAHLDFASPLLTKTMTESKTVDVFDLVSEVELVMRPCVVCAKFLGNIDPKDVLSLEMDQPSFHCPILTFITLKNGMEFCVDLSDPEISTMLEKLEMQD
ncbi:uncharacterized protein LOC118338022 [Morone saxatilis]|uniref:uncharacterized protein LOC118338022 n=1 Tax=Morone saxatilis TaxID=34816 RepID=UPI0015E1F793|nr:uncharacterized protein LOC118338022 [Morone saxatilis]